MEYNYSATAPCIYSELADIALEDKFPCDCGFKNRSDDQIEEKYETIPAISCVPDGRSGSLGSGNVAHSSLEVERKRQKSVVSLSSSGVLAPDSMDSGDTTGDNKRNGGKRQKQQKPKPKQKQQLSVDPQSIAARQRRHRISKKFKILQSMVPGGSKMDTASMLDEAIQYVKFLKMQIWLHDQTMASLYSTNGMISAATHCSTGCDDPASQIFSQNAANMPYTACNSTTVGLVQRNPTASAGSIDSIGGILYGAAVNDRYYT